MKTSILRLSILFITILLQTTLLQAQAPAKQDSIKPPKRLSWMAVPAFGYAPETRAYVGAVGLVAFKLAQDSLTRSSNAKAEINYTQNRQLILETGGNFFTPREKYFVSTLLAYRKFPEYWWGIGNDTKEEAEELYQANRIELDLRVLRSLGKNWFAGGLYTLRHMYDIEPTPGGILDQQAPAGHQGGLSSGLGIAILHDSRDNLLNPQRGHFLDIEQQFFASAFGSDFSFTRFGLDARTYIPIHKKHILAFQGKIGLQSGQPPFRMLSLLGSANDMRGYYQGRYRDRDHYALQAEYRLPLFWRIGIAGFAGIGDVGRTPSDFFTSTTKYTLGGGLRFLMDKAENINLRFDFAWGRQSTGFYVAFGEAF